MMQNVWSIEFSADYRRQQLMAEAANERLARHAVEQGTATPQSSARKQHTLLAGSPLGIALLSRRLLGGVAQAVGSTQ